MFQPKSRLKERIVTVLILTLSISRDKFNVYLDYYNVSICFNILVISYIYHGNNFRELNLTTNKLLEA